jgi:hypothetical protein
MSARTAGFGIFAISLVGCTAIANPVAEAVVDRTRYTTATYAVYLWGSAVGEDGKAEEHWSAEFHSGDWHRMDGPNMRVIANCRTHVGYFHDVATGETTNAPNAYRGSCGIYDAPNVINVALLPQITGGGQRLDQVEVTDAKFVRLYAIDQRGVIVGSDWMATNGSAAPCIKTRALAVLSTLPEADIFSKESIGKSIVPSRYQSAPRSVPELELSGRKCGSMK